MTLSTETHTQSAETDSGLSIDTDTLVRVGSHAILIIASLIAITPFVWAFMTSLKQPDAIFTTVSQLVPANPTVENYVTVWVENPFDRWVFNSLILTVGAVFVTLLLDSLAGYALAKGNFVGRSLVFTAVLGTLVIPPQVVMVPLYIEMQWLDWHNTYWAMMALYVANPFGTYLMRQFFLGIPDDLLEAARMDGCSTIQIYTRIMLPMAKPALSSLAIFTFVFTWGGFLWPLVITNETAMFPLQVGIGLLSGPYTQQWGPLLAASLLAAFPVLMAYLLAQRSFMEGITLSGRKG
ncbi:carbohydrate ABC transporter permease [Haloferax sp. DFSO52]|uniref:carbohydrate ABC transporter permease n=1 Tax=Haloferax sp. DFSO52 TaxID=3388505 RepID=UPI003A88CDAC